MTRHKQTAAASYRTPDAADRPRDKGANGKGRAELPAGQAEPELDFNGRPVIPFDGDAEPPLEVTDADLKTSKVSYLWDGRVPRGELVVLEGHKCAGKSTIAVAIAAAVTTGKPLPGGPKMTRGKVVYLAGEDALSTTVIPRLRAAGSRKGQVIFPGHDQDGIHSGPLLLPNGIGRLRDTVERHKARLVIIDPLPAFLQPGVRLAVDGEVRSTLLHLSSLARRADIPILLLRNLVKKPTGDVSADGQGSIAFSGTVRALLRCEQHPGRPGHYLLAVARNNLAPCAPTLGFRIVTRDQAGAVEWGTEEPFTADDLAGGGGDPTARDWNESCQEWMREALSEGPVKVSVLMERAREAGYTDYQVRVAKTALGLKHQRVGFGSGAHYVLSLHLP
jgi:energy-coupling factor transporter ATP-binding protein EcfA2